MSRERIEKEKRGKKRKLREAEDGEQRICNIHELFNVLSDNETLQDFMESRGLADRPGCECGGTQKLRFRKDNYDHYWRVNVMCAKSG